MNLHAPVFVTGTPRSGKSVVARIISQSGEFASISEPHSIWDIGFGNREDDRRAETEINGNTKQQIIEACQLYVTKAEKQRYLDDLAYHSLRLPFLTAIAPQGKIIHVVRHPRKVIPEMLYGWTYKDKVTDAVRRRIASINLRTLPRLALRFARNYFKSRVQGHRATWGPRVPGQQQYAANHSLPELVAYQWQMMVSIAHDDITSLHEGNTLEVCFDHILENPEHQARRIVDFCQVDHPQKVIDYATNHINPNFTFDSLVHPTDEQWLKVDQMLAPLCQSLGYWENSTQP